MRHRPFLSATAPHASSPRILPHMQWRADLARGAMIAGKKMALHRVPGARPVDSQVHGQRQSKQLEVKFLCSDMNQKPDQTPLVPQRYRTQSHVSSGIRSTSSVMIAIWNNVPTTAPTDCMPFQNCNCIIQCIQVARWTTCPLKLNTTQHRACSPAQNNHSKPV